MDCRESQEAAEEKGILEAELDELVLEYSTPICRVGVQAFGTRLGPMMK